MQKTQLRPAAAVGLSVVAAVGMAAAIIVSQRGGQPEDDFGHGSLALILGAVAILIPALGIVAMRSRPPLGRLLLAAAVLLAIAELTLIGLYL